MKAFEIHTFKEGKWRIDSLFDDREIAIYEAERMDSSGRFTGVRVIEEIYDEETQETRTRTIYRGQRAEQEAADRLAESRRRRKSTQRRPAGGGDPSRAKGRAPAKKSNGGAVGMVALLGLLVLLGLGLLIGLRYMEQLM